MERLTLFHDVLDIDGRYVLINTKNSAAIELDSENYLLYKKNKDTFINIISTEEKQLLRDMEFITNKTENDEIFINKFNYHISKFKDYDLLKLDIAITPVCNFRCTYCYESFSKNKITDKVTDEIRKNLLDNISKYVLDVIAKNQDLKTVQIVWFGGEPLIEIDLLLKISQKLKEITDNYSITLEIIIVTNGYLLKPEILISGNIPIKYIQVTIDGTKEVHNKKRILKNGKPTFDTILKNIEKSLYEGLQIVLRINVDKENIETMYNFLEFINNKFRNFIDSKQLYIDISRIFGTEKSLDYYSFFDKKNKLTPMKFSEDSIFSFGTIGAFCSAETYNSNIILDIFGNTYQCWNHVYNKQDVSGHILDKSITKEKIQNRLKYIEKASLDNFPACFKCPYVGICGGLCPDIRLNILNGEENNLYPIKCKEIIQNQLSTYYKSVRV